MPVTFFLLKKVWVARCSFGQNSFLHLARREEKLKKRRAGFGYERGRWWLPVMKEQQHTPLAHRLILHSVETKREKQSIKTLHNKGATTTATTTTMAKWKCGKIHVNTFFVYFFCEGCWPITFLCLDFYFSVSLSVLLFHLFL